jgi:hypothetical protein
MKTLPLKIRPSSVNLLRFILEAYDNMFILTTVDRTKGLVKIIFVEGSESELDSILDSIKKFIKPKKTQ